MQLNKLSPIAGVFLAALLSACGGGKGDDPVPEAAPAAAPAVSVSSVTLSSTTPTAIAEAALQFDGGVCGGGTGALTASWDFGDNTGSSHLNTHTYADAASGPKIVKVTCTDAAGATNVATLNLTVASAAMNGFLGKTWSTYASIDTTNVSPYPVASLAATSGDIYGVWLRKVSGSMEVAAGTTNFSLNSWTVSGVLPTGSDKSSFDDILGGGHTAAIDIAVSPNGHAMAAWIAGTSVYYATRNVVTGVWTNPVNIAGPVLDRSVKVVVNDAGDGAIAYCASTTDARVVTYSHTTTPLTQAPVTISKQCGIDDTDALAHTLQRHHSFGIAIDSASKISAVGIQNATLAPAPSSAVAVKSYTVAGGWTTPVAIVDELAAAPDSLSYALSPNGNFAAITWNQVSTTTPFKSNVFTSIYANSVWGTPTAVQNDYITKDYTRPLIVMNDHGVAFLAMRLKDLFGNYKTEVSNYDAGATVPAWSKPFQVSDIGLKTVDIAIDNWGTGLITRSDDYYSQAGTFSKAGTWSNFKNISPRYPSVFESTFHYQTMRALPDGRAILVTSVYDDITATTTTTKPIASGYVLLK